MKKTLQISPTLELPLDAVTQTFGVLAVRGAGKSNTAAAMAEEMHAAALPFVVIDPVGSWWGLRSSGDGKAEGLPVAILGGRHGDVPLERTGGALVADLVVDDRLTCVLDVSEFSEGDKVRFLIDFAERLYRRNTEPLHLFLEEADDYVPQRPFREQARLLGAWENIVRRGRARGLGITMITQRSAALNKNVLTQIETLIVLRTTSPQDRKAIEAWVQYAGAGAEMLKTLSQLESGEAWVWSPSWLKRFERVRIRRRWTYDSGATPKNAKGTRAPATLADVDLGALTARMAETIERQKAEDPKALRAELGAAREQLRKALDMNKRLAELLEAAKAASTPDPVGIEQLGLLVPLAASVAEDAGRLQRELLRAREAAVEARLRDNPQPSPAAIPDRALDKLITAAVIEPVLRQASGHGEGESIGGALRKVLIALAQRPQGLTRKQIGVRAGVSVRSSTFDTNMSEARKQGWLEGAGGLVRITPKGLEALGRYEALPTGAGLRAHWLAELGATVPGRILAVLVDKFPMSLTKDRIGELAKCSTRSSTFDTAMSTLRKLDLVITSAGHTNASPELFE